MTRPARTTPRTLWRDSTATDGARTLPEETPIALTYNRATHAVMLATPSDLEDFALGFSLSEGIVTAPEQIEELEIVPAEQGIELRMWLAADRADTLTRRQRRLAGPSGCGLCGLDSLADTIRPLPAVTSGACFDAETIFTAMRAMSAAQQLNRETRGVHAAGFWHPAHGLVALREDVGRHNALDKLAGALARESADRREGLVLMSSRISLELVQKTAIIGAAALVAVSVPTALAVRTAEAAGLTLIGIARDDTFEVFTRGDRIVPRKVQHVA